MKLTVEEFIKLRNIIYDKAGIFFETKKIYFFNKRLEKRMEELSLTDVEEYCNILKYKDRSGQEIQTILNLMTTNETYFYREENQLNVFRDYCLPEVLDYKRKAHNHRLKIWCAGCSSGEEAYTLAILLREKLIDLQSWQVELLAGDIDTDVLKIAREGLYPQRAIRFVTPYILSKYFTNSGDNYQVIPVVKQMVQFQHLNLMDSLKMRLVRNVDFVFCRNVLIYFDDVSRKSVVANFYDSLNPGGYIYLGYSESITRISTAFNIKRAGGLIVHQKAPLQEV